MNLDWFLLNPVMKGYISYADLKNGTVNLYDMFVLNELINYEQRVQEEQIRVRKRDLAVNRK